MSLSGRSVPNNVANAHFYLPDLCSITALLPLILVGQLLSLALALAASQLPVFNWLRFSLLSTEILWIVLLGAALLCRLRPLLQRISPASGVALCFTALIIVIALVAITGQWFLSYLTLDWRNSVWIVIQHIAVGGILSGLVLRYFYLQQQLNVQQQAQMQATMQARFQSLQSRIRPHFLFNSMNIIAITCAQSLFKIIERHAVAMIAFEIGRFLCVWIADCAVQFFSFIADINNDRTAFYQRLNAMVNGILY